MPLSIFHKNCSLMQKRCAPLYADILFSAAKQKQELLFSHLDTIPSLPDCHTLYYYGIDTDLFSYYQAWQKRPFTDPLGRDFVIIVDNVKECISFLHCQEALAILQDPHVHFITLVEKRVKKGDIQRLCREKIDVIAPQKKDKDFERIKKEIVELNFLFYAQKSTVFQMPHLWENFKNAIQFFPKSFDVSQWKEAFSNVPALICGAGPSLEKDISHIRKFQKKGLVIAGGSAISALAHEGIEPHLALGVDPTQNEYDHLKKYAPYSFPLLYSTLLYKDVFSLFQGSLGYMHSDTPWERALLDHSSYSCTAIKSDDIQALSVTTRALFIAHFLGCDPVIFSGVDLGYVDHRHYAKGIEQTQSDCKERHLSFSNEGHPLFTSYTWQIEAKALSVFAKNHPHLQLYTTAKKGMKIDHVTYCPLQEFLDKKPVDTAKKIQHLIKKTPMNISRDDIEQFTQNIAQSLSRSSHYIQKIQKASFEELGTKVLYQMELEQEMAYPLFFQEIQDLLQHTSMDVWQALQEFLKAF